MDILFAAKHSHRDGSVLEVLEGSQMTTDGRKCQVLQFVGFRHVVLETDHAFFLELFSLLRPLSLLLELPCFPEDLVLVFLVQSVQMRQSLSGPSGLRARDGWHSRGAFENRQEQNEDGSSWTHALIGVSDRSCDVGEGGWGVPPQERSPLENEVQRDV